MVADICRNSVQVGRVIYVLHIAEKTPEKGGVSIFVHKNLKFTKINLEYYCKDHNLEACALKLDSTDFNISQ
jgi:hypothetical protein